MQDGFGSGCLSIREILDSGSYPTEFFLFQVVFLEQINLADYFK